VDLKYYITRSFMICASSPNIIWVIKSRRMRWAGYVAHRETGELRTSFWWGDLRERDRLEDHAYMGG